MTFVTPFGWLTDPWGPRFRALRIDETRGRQILAMAVRLGVTTQWLAEGKLRRMGYQTPIYGPHEAFK